MRQLIERHTIMAIAIALAAALGALSDLHLANVATLVFLPA